MMRILGVALLTNHYMLPRTKGLNLCSGHVALMAVVDVLLQTTETVGRSEEAWFEVFETEAGLTAVLVTYRHRQEK